ncbi:MAG: signal peptidase I [bacterium]|nr:signal peptidase I [bacterium]
MDQHLENTQDYKPEFSDVEKTQSPDPQPIEPQENPPAPAGKKENFWGEIIRFTIFALIIVLPIRLFIAQPFIVSGASMDPTFETGEYLIVDQLSYRLGNPERGEVIIFKYPKDESKYFIKRVIGLPGETIELEGTLVTIKNKQYPEGLKLAEPYITDNNEKEEYMTVTLKEGQYFVMGDNRRQSSDSRAWGTLSRNLIVGTPFVRLFPLNKVSVYPGELTN